MGGHLELLAEASLAVAAAEQAVGETAWQTARDRIDAAAAALDELRTAWPAMTAAERAVVGPSAKSVRDRLDAAAARVPRHSVLAAIPAEDDPEQETEPEAA